MSDQPSAPPEIRIKVLVIIVPADGKQIPPEHLPFAIDNARRNAHVALEMGETVIARQGRPNGGEQLLVSFEPKAPEPQRIVRPQLVMPNLAAGEKFR
jgi:hypothetical protein